MKIHGLIFEANPFHLGHIHLINESLKDSPDLTVAITSDYFSMRGEISVINKMNKTDILLHNKIDLVIELPINYTLNSSDIFGESAVLLLNKAKITDLYFGIEKGSLNDLLKIIEIEKQDSFQEIIKQKYKTSLSYKKAYIDTIKLFVNDEFIISIIDKPNITLALSYLRTIKKYNLNITPHVILRKGSDDNNLELTEYPSGSAIRDALYNNKVLPNSVIYQDLFLKDLNNCYENLFLLIKKLKLDDANYEHLLVNQDIKNYIFKNIHTYYSYKKFINDLANKNYTKSRIRRTLISMLLNLKPINEPYFRVLGFNNLGESHLKKIDNIITNISKHQEILNDTLKAAMLYDIITKQQNYLEEFKFPRKVK